MKRLLFLTAVVASQLMAHITLAQDFVYLLPSKEIAETGEDLWFKAYLLNRQTFALSDKSQTLYLQIRTQTDSVVWSEKYPLAGGRCNGHIRVGEEWPQGEYFLEGYAKTSFTSDSTQAIHPRRIRVVDRVAQMNDISAQAVKNDSIQKCTSRHRFDLFPEGGNLIDGVNSVVAFKATYGDGFPEDVTGRVLENGSQIAEIQCIHDGMGQFAVTPRIGNEYKVVLSDGREYPFPAIERSGLALRVTRHNASGITLLVSASDSVSHSFSINSKLNGIPCSSASGTVKGQQLVRLPIEQFPFQGIVEITLNNGNGIPIAERLVYVNPEQTLSVVAEPDQKHYQCRDGGTVRLQVTDAAGQPVKAELAVSIFDKEYLYLPGHENILSHCFLSEQISGDIFNPTYYFDTENDDRLAALDLLLMTQGWRRYVWNRDPMSALQRQLLKDGVIGFETARRNRPDHLQYIQLISPEKVSYIVKTDTLGLFEVEPYMMCRLKDYFYLKPFTLKPGGKLHIINQFDTINTFRPFMTSYLAQNKLNMIEEESHENISEEGTTIRLKGVTVKAKKKPIYCDKIIEFLDSIAIVKSGVWACEHDGKQYINEYKGYSLHPACSPFSDCKGKRLMPKRGESYLPVKLVEQGGVWVNLVEKMGAIVYHGPEGPKVSEKGLLSNYGMETAQSYYPQREFYEPDPAERYSPTPDPRNLLQWRPAVLTDENGVAEIPFITSDINSEFIGIVEAIDGGGLLGCQTFSFKVLK